MPSPETRYSSVSRGRGAGIEVTAPCLIEMAVVARTLKGFLGREVHGAIHVRARPGENEKSVVGVTANPNRLLHRAGQPRPVFGYRDYPFLEFPNGIFRDCAQFDGLVSRGFPPRQIVNDAEGSPATHHKPAEDFERLAAVLLFDFGRSHAPRSSHRNENPVPACESRVFQTLFLRSFLDGLRRKTYHFSTNRKEVQK